MWASNEALTPNDNNMNAEEFVNEMDSIAQNYFGEFGYDTCSTGEKKAIIELLLHNTK